VSIPLANRAKSGSIVRPSAYFCPAA
jgi:hypothetical protein